MQEICISNIFTIKGDIFVILKAFFIFVKKIKTMKLEKKETIYVTWHYTTHGLAYLKHILSAFYINSVSIETLKSYNVSQQDMNRVFDEYQNGFLFDKVYYLTANQEVFDKLSSRRFSYKNEILNDPEIQKNKTLEIWQKIIQQNFNYLEEEIAYVKKYFPAKSEDWLKQIWRNIHHYTIEDQLIWWKKYSNVHANYKNEHFFTEIKTQITDLRNHKEIAEKLKLFIDNLKIQHPNAQFIINVSLGSNETQVVWQIFGELNLLPQNTQFVRTYDNKILDSTQRFKLFDIEEIPVKIISHIQNTLQLYPSRPETHERKLAELKMQHYLKSGFIILIMGERGIGKSQLAEKVRDNKKIISTNCASFSDDSMAESELFGYKKGAFTGANTDKEGLFKEAENGILFLDEIHHLSHRVQAKLMKAIQTDSNNFLTIRRLGDNLEIKLQTTLIFASNQNISKLRETLLPDFYDRISQQVIELPPLRITPEELENEFYATWQHMKFEQFFDYQKYVLPDKKLLNWIKTLDLYGNYRDLQKISIFYKNYLSFNTEIKKVLTEKTAFDFTKSEYEKYIALSGEDSQYKPLFSDKFTAEQMEDEFKQQLSLWAIDRFKGAPNAAKHFHKLGGKTTKETLYKWKTKNIN